MDTPITIVFRHLDRSFGLVARSRDLAQRLASINDRITSCHVTIEGHGHHSLPGPVQVSLDLVVPGGRIHAESAHRPEWGDGDAYAALRAAFADARRQLVEFARRRSSVIRRAKKGQPARV
jgi:hypothetical protein